MDWIKKWWIAHASALVAAAYFLIPSAQTYVNAHPKTTVGVLLGAVVTAFLSRAPKDRIGS